jgi:hypothetical protein
MPSHPSALARKSIAAAISMLWLAAATLRSETQLRVVSPENGVVVNAGLALSVTIETPPSVFQSISIAGNGPFALSTSLSAPPYRYSYSIPVDFPSGCYRFQAAGVTASGETVRSNPIEVDVERPGDVKKLQSEYQSLTFGDEKELPLQIWGIFADGSRIDVTRSRRMAYTSDRPAVATVTPEGAVSAVAAGKAKITAKYGDRSIVIVPVVVTHNPVLALRLTSKDPRREDTRKYDGPPMNADER